MNYPLITVGISTYNRSKSLENISLPSIKNLSYPNYEVVIIDDCSTDKTPIVLKEHQQKIERLRFFRNSKNSGVCYSRNRIMTESSGEIIVFMDDDVSIFPDCLDKILDHYNSEPEVLFIWGGVYECHGNHDSNKLDAGSGSLFSIKRIIANHLTFDTNIGYLKTYVTEEHEFARRVNRAKAKIIKSRDAKCNHYAQPAANRAFRGLGGDINRLYGLVKNGSIPEYYKSLFIGLLYPIQYVSKKTDLQKVTNQNPYPQAVRAWFQILTLLKYFKFIKAGKYLFYIVINIPIKAYNRRLIDQKEIQELQKSLLS
ncbi:MAG: glycosyltransferase family 2 protein [Okeania sp. SIO2F4]|uniref:glycosyltransferase family 2 protein n=1 Tax=Okeania sp. SIO2F4 TaxID=2607790 RepID=UPI00142B2EAC|nr:glycosyltransferase family 2 protein [Okeania sp. SIO2F4]NES05953.1 glycosyltransferase family 2 protein [Okeania sp. SIO2F4]